MNQIVSNDDVIFAAFKILSHIGGKEKELSDTVDFGDFESVFWSYVEVAERLLPLYKSEGVLKRELGFKLQGVVKYCIQRAEVLKAVTKGKKLYEYRKDAIINLYSQVAKYSLEKALIFDERKMGNISLKWYLSCIDYFMNIRQLGGSIDEKVLVNIFDRAEYWKKLNESGGKNRTRTFNPSEIEALKLTSVINGLTFLPFVKSEDILEKFYLYDPFNDPDGKLKLSKSQLKHSPVWKRPSMFMSKPVMISSISPYSITQSVVTDCSFVSSLIVTSNYERRFGKPLITNCIFPQKKGIPIYNPSGKYMVKLFVNGVWRKIIIDDFFPINERTNKLLCSHSSNKNELWISVIEKAFIKINGGYDFPGSNSGIDLQTLTGWIPESHRTSRSDFNADVEWERMKDGTRFGQCLMTISTGPLGSHDYEAVGLTEGHAYAVLDVREVLGHRLLLVKNPWRKRRWKGKFSPQDGQNWTRALREKLNYDLIGALQYDNGVFWIDYESTLTYFESLHYSWNPKMFPYESNYHGFWSKLQKPYLGVDEYNVGRSPQFRLILDGHPGKNTWVMLSKHCLSIDDDNDYIALLIADETMGKRVYRKTSFKPINKVVYSNNQHRRYCINQKKGGIQAYTLIVSQLDKVNPFGFTIQAYGQTKCKIIPLPSPIICAFIAGNWSGFSAAGSVNHSDTYQNNPQIRMVSKITETLRFNLEVKEKKNACINMIIFNNCGKKIQRPTSNLIVKSSGTYTNAFSTMTMEVKRGVLYTIVVSTFDKGIEDRFLLTVEGPKGSVDLSFL